MISITDVDFCRVRSIRPETEPQLYPGIAPFPVWLITPTAMRAAWLSAITSEIIKFQIRHALPNETPTIEQLPRWLSLLGVSYKPNTMEVWDVRRGETIIVWRSL